MLAFLAVRGIAPLALDVLILGAGGLPTGAGTETDLEVIDRHAVTSVVVLTHAVSRRETGIVRPYLSFGFFWTCIVDAKFEEETGSMLPSIGMEPQDELQQLMARQAALKQELTAKKTALQEAQRRQRDTLTRQIRRAQARLSAADRKRRTRRLILIGSYIEQRHASSTPASHDQAHERAR